MERSHDMRNASKVVGIDAYPLHQIDFLKGTKTEFNSLAEMIVRRAAEIPDKPFVLFYDQVITCRQVHERANRMVMPGIEEKNHG